MNQRTLVVQQTRFVGQIPLKYRGFIRQKNVVRVLAYLALFLGVLARAGAERITIFHRTSERATFLVDDLAEVFPASHLTFEPLNSETLTTLPGMVDLVINTTSVGMHPQSDTCPWPADVSIPPDTVFYDLVYNPLDTLFLQRARAAGISTIDGLGMFVHQGVFAFEKWTGRPAPVEVMPQVCRQELEHHQS